jgi:para-nitrobenzyl esterase
MSAGDGPADPIPASTLVASTPSGKLRGGWLPDPGVLVFRGVRYGESPAGAARWKPPVPVKPWEGVADATAFGAICPQSGKVGSYTRERRKLPQSEDCLFLNVWTPALAGRRPVLVWLHGRGFAQGGGSEPLYDGAALAARGDVVVVTINHRLNVFGYAHLEELAGPEYAGSGVAGMLDAELALRWVRDSIAAFGGDPGCVTIFGESGGGVKVSTLLAMPSAQGLFHRAVIQSGPGIRAVSARRGTANARALVSALGLAHVSDLVQVPADTLRAAAEALTPQWAPVVDGVHLPVHPFEPEPAPTALGIPILIGTCRDESALFLAGDPRRGALSEEDLARRTDPLLGDQRDAVIAAFRASRPEATPWDLFVAISSHRFHHGSVLLAERQSAATRTPVWMYSFEFAGTGRLGPAHGLEIDYVFANASAGRPGDARVAQVETDMSQAWIAFARTGDPNHAAIPTWAPYTSEHRATLIFDAPSRVVVDPRRAEREAYARVDLRRTRERGAPAPD